MESGEEAFEMLYDLEKVIESIPVLSKGYINRDGFNFTAIGEPTNVYNALIIKNPQNAACWSPHVPTSARSLEEHIALVNEYKLEKAQIVAEDLSFITRCPTLKHLTVIPADNTGDRFDFSPLYEMPEIKNLVCLTDHEEDEKLFSCVDYSRIKGLEELGLSGRGHLNYNKLKTLKSLFLSKAKSKAGDLTDQFISPVLREITLMLCNIRSLKGIEQSSVMRRVSLSYNRILEDITPLRAVSETLEELAIENCPKITDFSILSELKNLRHLQLSGSNDLPSLSFLDGMKNLRTFSFSMNVVDGNLEPCMRLPYASCGKGRKHYNLRDKDLPKG